MNQSSNDNNQNDNGQEAKQRLRRHFRTKRRQRDDRLIQAAVERMLADMIARTTLIRGGGHIGIYWPLPGETDLRSLPTALKPWPLALPCSDGAGGLTYRPWDGGPLPPDSSGIPAPQTGRLLMPQEIQILLVPALAVDLKGVRLGYGGGYYDRLRADPHWKSVKAMVVVAEACISPVDLPRSAWDLPFDGWVSERGVECSAVERASQPRQQQLRTGAE